MERRGKKGEVERQTEAVVAVRSTVTPFAPAPDELEPEAAAYWRSIVQSRPAEYFSAGDWPLLEAYCYTTKTLLPKLNALIENEFDLRVLDQRDKTVRQAAALARSLRICVSSRTRPDVGMHKSVLPQRPWERADRQRAVAMDAAQLKAEFAALFEGRAHDLREDNMESWSDAIGYERYWPPIDEVWECRGEPRADSTDAERGALWEQAWAVLERLHAECQFNRERKADA